MKTLLLPLLLCFTLITFSQKKILDHPDFDIWNTIKSPTISPDGDYIMYSLEKGEKDNFLRLKDAKANTILKYDRAEKGQFSYDSKFAIFTIKPWEDSIVALKRKKAKKDKFPSDSLAVYNIKTKELTKIGNFKSYKIPRKWSGYIAYQLEAADSKAKEKDASKTKKKTKKVSRENGYHLVLRNLVTKKQDTFKYVTNYSFAEKGKYMVFTSTGETEKTKSSVQVYDIENNKLNKVHEAKKAKYYQINFSETGKNLTFVADTDTTKILQRPYELYHWNANASTVSKLVDKDSAPKGYAVSSNGRTSFSKDESKLFFGLATPQIVKDTTLIDEEIVNVEVWTYDEPRLYTVQELQVRSDKNKSYKAAFHLKTNKLVQIETPMYNRARLGNEGNSKYALVENSLPYQIESQWDGLRSKDVAIANVENGTHKKILTKFSGNVSLSPLGNFAYGYDKINKTWFLYNINTSKHLALTKGKVFYNELNDSPTPANSYGIAGWTKDEKSVLLYDRYDIWEFDTSTGKETKLTNGRASKIVYRYIKLDNEVRFIDTKNKWLLSTFNEVTKSSGYYEYNPKNKKGKQLIEGPYKYGTPRKAKFSDAVIYTKESFIEFPNIHLSDLSFKKSTVISNANPQQKEYNWGTNELVKWTSLDGVELTGMLVKPENFDPSKKYPMIVNFYERSSDGLYSHKAPSPGRSTINYSFYTSRGYLIFNPDIQYKIGYPGESAYNSIIPGVNSLIEKGFVDKDNIGLQGHSWGGYQIAHLVTKTDMFKAAESGAPVVNMISAYGGIRWGSGLSRQFQYEHTQSRIGATPWESPKLYLENSPVFNLDKVNTPLLILHNDADGHVPWYQGIEFFTGLRRLQKPSWMLNYNDEPHWPLKIQNRKDFNIRMAQFFDHYLKGAPKPVWMQRGVPALEKGINQGYELIEE